MSSWIISVPVWTDRYCQTFGDLAVPALRAALADFKEDFRFIIHTDKPRFIEAVLSGFKYEIRSIPAASTYVALQNGHSDAIRAAKPGERVALLNADLIVSKNLFTACETHFTSGKRAVVTAGIRTNLGRGDVPIGVEPRALLEWAWEARHLIIRDLEWGRGGSQLPTNLFFAYGNSVILRGFHLHPVAILKDKDLSFKSTIDGDLLDHFRHEEIHVVTHPDDLAMLEMSPKEKRFPVGRSLMSPASVAAAMHSRASPMHRWLFQQRIIIKGDGSDRTDIPVCIQILQALELYRTQTRKSHAVGPVFRR